jgi:hypothetical protein
MVGGGSVGWAWANGSRGAEVDEGEPEIKSAGFLEGLGRIRMWRIVLYALGRRFGGFTARDIMSSENLDTAHAMFSAWSDLYRINLIKRESRVTGDIALGALLI